ncbi:MAG: S8 family serine peptidase [Cyanobacteria bacterium J06639_14]
MPPKIYAEAVIRSASMESLLQTGLLVESKNVSLFHAPPDRLAVAAARLEKAGFDVLDKTGKISINIAAPPEIYERSFGTTLEVVERPVTKELGLPSSAAFVNSIDQKPFGEIDVANTHWSDILDGVAINDPAYYLQSPVSSAVPPPTNARYLQVPDELADALSARLAHEQGITGKGIKVVVVDSGCFTEHKFFKHHRYKLNVALGPGSRDRHRDDNGHGTGVAANVFAVAPHVDLTVVKADVALGNKARNINSTAAFRKAVSLNPDIISCSWGSDLRRPDQLSSSHKVLAAEISEAVRQGIVVIFAAGNGQWGFPSQHRDVIAVGGVYKHLEGSLKGRLEASNYASSFISTIYRNRQVPDVCGLVGQLPDAAYIMLPVAPGSVMDRGRSLMGDETEATDGWAAFSGTSSAAPQLAGACALLEQFVPGLSPLKTRDILRDTAHDIREGRSNPASGGGKARAGPDLATGYGLTVAHRALQAAKASMRNTAQAIETSISKRITLREDRKVMSVKHHKTYRNPIQRRQNMKLEFPKLEANLEEISWELQEVLEKYIQEGKIEDIQLLISESNFVTRSPIDKAAYALRKSLSECFEKTSGSIISNKVEKKHVFAAQGLLKLGRYQATAIQLLTDTLKHKKMLGDSIIEALSECSSEISSFDGNKINEHFSFYEEVCIPNPNCGGKRVLHELYRYPNGESKLILKPGCQGCN